MTEDPNIEDEFAVDQSSGWRDVREMMGLNRYMDMEDEDYLELAADGSGEKPDLSRKEQADWAMKWISEDLTKLYEEENELWIMLYSEDSLEPVMYVDEDTISISPIFDPDIDSSIEIDDEELDISPLEIIEGTGYTDTLLGKDYHIGGISHQPRLKHGDYLNQVSDIFLQGKFAAPGMEEVYYDRAEKAIERFVNDE